MNRDYESILKLKIVNCAGVEHSTIGKYLHDLLKTLWCERYQFSGKRPFGNSSWEYELYAALINSGVICGKIDKDGYILEVDEDAGWVVIDGCIDYIFGKVK